MFYLCGSWGHSYLGIFGFPRISLHLGFANKNTTDGLDSVYISVFSFFIVGGLMILGRLLLLLDLEFDI